MKKDLLTVCCILLIFPLFADADTAVEESFKKAFPQHKFENINPTPIKGVYEVYTGGQIFYYLPEAEAIMTGNIITKEGVNLTQESNSKKMAVKMEKIPLESALKIGTGKTTVVEFTDPNCPYCRKAALYLGERKDVTTYVFLIPLSQDSEKKIKHIFCSKNKAKAYDDVMAGKFDNNASLNLCENSKVDEQIKTHRQLAAQAGIRATPTFYLKGKVVTGFEKNNMDNVLKK